MFSGVPRLLKDFLHPTPSDIAATGALVCFPVNLSNAPKNPLRKPLTQFQVVCDFQVKRFFNNLLAFAGLKGDVQRVGNKAMRLDYRTCMPLEMGLVKEIRGAGGGEGGHSD